MPGHAMPGRADETRYLWSHVRESAMTYQDLVLRNSDVLDLDVGFDRRAGFHTVELPDVC
jgi:hypothetical protein